MKADETRVCFSNLQPVFVTIFVVDKLILNSKFVARIGY